MLPPPVQPKHSDPLAGPSLSALDVLALTVTSPDVSVTDSASARRSLAGRQRAVAQLVPAPHTTPQPPQFMSSVCGSTHEAPQGISVPVQLDAMQLPLTHVGVPPVQMLPHVPQFIESMSVRVQAEPQSVVGDGQAQALLSQVWPDGHVVPQAPQLAVSLVTSTQEPPQRSLPAGQPQVLLEQA
jgi:hypothetical protein